LDLLTAYRLLRLGIPNDNDCGRTKSRKPHLGRDFETIVQTEDKSSKVGAKEVRKAVSATPESLSSNAGGG